MLFERLSYCEFLIINLEDLSLAEGKDRWHLSLIFFFNSDICFDKSSLCKGMVFFLLTYFSFRCL